ncbi:hypothetical protein GLAREA_01744 [Glarea lozoyensis ATCC 20868]|uniref:Uncharacterized protein n=1 Tax=Glarea lozoyensis (strain ATCC 20868 / MF5171) TaxID=1116229 RepID=S3CHA0_GLAL2|nr:uncharacterized protein GLAREA_01744 [Glarea lozoyensis ATCC 20868]EPE25832.1 hypothetical protein GLAREA_01744 [Glarea lozoyensis ATCC 20868]
MTQHKTLKEVAQENPTLLGDPTSLKAEKTEPSHSPTSKPSPTKPDESPTHMPPVQDTKSNPSNESKGYDVADKKTGEEKSGQGKNKLREAYVKGNPSQLGDPVSLKAEAQDSEPTEQDRGAGKTKSKL